MKNFKSSSHLIASVDLLYTYIVMLKYLPEHLGLNNLECKLYLDTCKVVTTNRTGNNSIFDRIWVRGFPLKRAHEFKLIKLIRICVCYRCLLLVSSGFLQACPTNFQPNQHFCALRFNKPHGEKKPLEFCVLNFSDESVS